MTKCLPSLGRIWPAALCFETTALQSQIAVTIYCVKMYFGRTLSAVPCPQYSSLKWFKASFGLCVFASVTQISGTEILLERGQIWNGYRVYMTCAKTEYCHHPVSNQNISCMELAHWLPLFTVFVLCLNLLLLVRNKQPKQKHQQYYTCSNVCWLDSVAKASMFFVIYLWAAWSCALCAPEKLILEEEGHELHWAYLRSTHRRPHFSAPVKKKKIFFI